MLDECAVNSFRDSCNRSAQTVAEHMVLYYSEQTVNLELVVFTLRKTEQLLKCAENSYINCKKGITFSRMIFLLLVSSTSRPGILFI